MPVDGVAAAVARVEGGEAGGAARARATAVAGQARRNGHGAIAFGARVGGGVADEGTRRRPSSDAAGLAVQLLPFVHDMIGAAEELADGARQGRRLGSLDGVRRHRSKVVADADAARLAAAAADTNAAAAAASAAAGHGQTLGHVPVAGTLGR